MTPGLMEFRAGGAVLRASCSPDGWSCRDKGVGESLGRAFPFPSTEAGEPWVIAFWAAADATGARVLQEPVPDPWPAGGAGG
jgi:hypothetical protein